MPTYVYECDEGHEFEVEQGMREEPLRECREERCAASCRRKILPTAFVLHGPGWGREGYQK